MRNVLICTVGTSLKGNLERSVSNEHKELLADKNIKGLVIELARLDPHNRILGAEINSIASILQKRMLAHCETLYLLISDTEDGTLIGKILNEYYRRTEHPWQFRSVIIQEIKGLTDSSAQRFRTEGLRNLVKAIASVVTKHGSNTILINATGGYKAQISFAGMIGQALEIPVCYLFERFSEVIELPPQPISMDLSFWLGHVDIFFDLAADEVIGNPVVKDERFASLIDEIEVDNQKLIGLSAVGQLFHETFRHRFWQQRQRLLPPDAGLRSEEKVIKYEDDNPTKHHGLTTWLKKLCDIPYVVRIYTHYFNPDLPGRNYFRPSRLGDVSQMEGGYSDGKATTKFDIVTTAKTKAQRDAALADLHELCR